MSSSPPPPPPPPPSPSPSATTGSLAALHPDLLSLILHRLDLVDFVRCRVVCRRWRSVARRPNPQPPWLMLSSSSAANPQSRHFYSLADRRTYEIRLPQIYGHYCVGSTGGSLISVDADARLHITNPLTGAHFTLPGPTALPNLEAAVCDPASGVVTDYLFWADAVPCTRYSMYHMRTHYFHKAILVCPSDVVTVFIIHGNHGDIAFVRPLEPSWTALKSPIRFFKDLIFHKGRLHAVDSAGRLAVFEPPPRPSWFISPRRPAGMQEDDNVVVQKHYLVESPDGNDLFLIYQEMKRDQGEEDGEDVLALLFFRALTRTAGFQVLRLDERECGWREVADVGDFALFLGFNQPVWVSSPDLRRNCIYFADDDMRVCDLGDGSITNLDIDLRQLSLSPTAIWFTHVHHQP